MLEQETKQEGNKERLKKRTQGKMKGEWWKKGWYVVTMKERVCKEKKNVWKGNGTLLSNKRD